MDHLPLVIRVDVDQESRLLQQSMMTTTTLLLLLLRADRH
jgi:hypothetical protein